MAAWLLDLVPVAFSLAEHGDLSGAMLYVHTAVSMDPGVKGGWCAKLSSINTLSPLNRTGIRVHERDFKYSPEGDFLIQRYMLNHPGVYEAESRGVSYYVHVLYRNGRAAAELVADQAAAVELLNEEHRRREREAAALAANRLPEELQPAALFAPPAAQWRHPEGRCVCGHHGDRHFRDGCQRCNCRVFQLDDRPARPPAEAIDGLGEKARIASAFGTTLMGEVGPIMGISQATPEQATRASRARADAAEAEAARLERELVETRRERDQRRLQREEDDRRAAAALAARRRQEEKTKSLPPVYEQTPLPSAEEDLAARFKNLEIDPDPPTPEAEPDDESC